MIRSAHRPPLQRPSGRRVAGPLALLLGLLAGYAALGAVLGAAPARAADPLATVNLSQLTPTVARPGGQLQVAGRIRGGTERLRDVQVALRLSQTPVNSRAELAGVASGLTTGKDGESIASTPLPDIPRKGSADFTLGRALRGLDGLDAFGVYVLSVEVSARHRSGQGRVAITRTFLPWVPADATVAPTPMAWIWPLVGQPPRQANGRFQDDGLSTAITGGGRLSRLTEAGRLLAGQQPLTWAIDGDLLDSVATMARGYRVMRTPATVTEPGTAAATTWLAQVRAATAGSAVLPVPYADPDLTALRRHGLGEDIATATTVSAAVIERVLDREQVPTDVAWPPGGAVDRRTLAVLRQNGATAVVLDSASQPTRLELNYTASGRSNVTSSAGVLTSLLSDSGLTRLLSDERTPPLLAAQRFLAETAMITAELPSAGDTRVVLAAPPSRWDPSQAFLDRLVTGLADASWLTGTSLEQMRSAAPSEVERRGLQYPRLQRRAELPRSYLAAVQSQHDRIGLLGKVIDPEDTRRSAVLANLDKSVLRLASTWWRTRREARGIRISNDVGYVSGQLRSIAVQPGSYTLGSNSGRVPLTISNGTNRSIVVTLHLEPRNRRLRLEPPERPVQIGPRRKVQVNVAATAIAAGPVVVDATLETVGGTPLATAPVQFTIQITQIGTVALFITIGAAGVLFLAAGVRIGRRARQARRTPPPAREVP